MFSPLPWCDFSSDETLFQGVATMALTDELGNTGEDDFITSSGNFVISNSLLEETLQGSDLIYDDF